MCNPEPRDWQSFLTTLLELLHHRAEWYRGQLARGELAGERLQAAEHFLARFTRLLGRSRHVQ